MEQQHRTLIGVAVAAVLLVAVGTYAYLFGLGGSTPLPESVVIHHRTDGVEHTYDGELVLSACSSLESMVTTGGPSLSIDLTTHNIASCSTKGDSVQSFSGSFSLERGAAVFNGVTLNGKPLEYTVVEEE